MLYLVVAGMFLVAVGCVGLAAFKAGYNCGWDERHRQMILPPKILRRVNKDLDDQEVRGRHSAMDPKKPVWH